MSPEGDRNRDILILSGKDGIECEEWIMSIQKEAFHQDKTDDKAWIAALASTRITGQALRWYVRQGDEITSDWIRLRAALLEQYPAESTDIVPDPPGVFGDRLVVPTSSTAPAETPPERRRKRRKPRANPTPTSTQSAPASIQSAPASSQPKRALTQLEPTWTQPIITGSVPTRTTPMPSSTGPLSPHMSPSNWEGYIKVRDSGSPPILWDNDKYLCFGSGHEIIPGSTGKRVLFRVSETPSEGIVKFDVAPSNGVKLLKLMWRGPYGVRLDWDTRLTREAARLVRAEQQYDFILPSVSCIKFTERKVGRYRDPTL
ncbi:hypothetical protein FS837_009830 [Tulasnella sp. UAMH 9824]|nr:hypothetical protein FS837_009830 [Tulasnella sp. UAMH 9824]